MRGERSLYCLHLLPCGLVAPQPLLATGRPLGLAVFPAAPAHDEAAPVAAVLDTVVLHPQGVADLVSQDVGRTEPRGGVERSYGSHHAQLN